MTYYKNIKSAFNTNEADVIRTLQKLINDDYNKLDDEFKRTANLRPELRKDWGKYRALLIYIEFLLMVMDNNFPDKELINRFIKRIKIDNSRTSYTTNELTDLIIKDITEIEYGYMTQQNQQGGRRRNTRRRRN